MAPCSFQHPDSCRGITSTDSGYVKQEMIKRFYYTVGTESCDAQNPSYCNGPLKSSSTFCVKLRVYSDDDYYDSPCSEYVKTVTEFPRDLIAVFIVPLLLVFIVIGAARLCQHRLGIISELTKAKQFYRFDLRQRLAAKSEVIDPAMTTVADNKNYTIEMADSGIIEGADEKSLASYTVIYKCDEASSKKNVDLPSAAARKRTDTFRSVAERIKAKN
ncbi:hypothetical protein EB796_020449 [Bugula neritina]|uniref:Uncharacterized protein n=1 Tax=Bugula neritina TaxID=10212 RepID=A0A7J7J6T1_BUGNE|nr:hypothetical protein EB796_020449 [Bugula neritina]